MPYLAEETKGGNEKVECCHYYLSTTLSEKEERKKAEGDGRFRDRPKKKGFPGCDGKALERFWRGGFF